MNDKEKKKRWRIIMMIIIKGVISFFQHLHREVNFLGKCSE